MGMRIYTRTGDEGMTGIKGGKRVLKTDQRIEANGALDELNSILGGAESFSGDEDIRRWIHEIQTTLMIVMSRVATPSALHDTNPRKLPENLIDETEKRLDEISVKCMTQEFVLPGGTPCASFLHQARAVCRRAERELWRLDKEDKMEPQIMKYINRLSDLLFAMARLANARGDRQEKVWRKFGAKE